MPDPKTGTGDQGRTRALVSTRLVDGRIVETVYRPDENRTVFCVFRSPAWSYEPIIKLGSQTIVPYSASNNLIRHQVVLLPSHAQEYGSQADLIERVRAFIHRYVDASSAFEEIAAHYVLLTWVYDDFNELPYLRVRGDYGSGKTRFLLTIGSLCYKPIFASGASTISPLFRILDSFAGTLIIDEGDFRFSDERAEVVKILNNGNAKGFPVLRSESTNKHEFDPRAYAVFGPKIIATRGLFEDRALESRCITEEVGHRQLRSDIPLNLPRGFKEESLQIRNLLLGYRFRNLGKERDLDALIDPILEPRLNQVLAPLMSVVDDPKSLDALKEYARRYGQEIVADRGTDIEAQVLEIIWELLKAAQPARLSVKDITSRFMDRFGQEYERRITTKWIGRVLRSKLHLRPQKSNGTFILPISELPKLDLLFRRYGVGLVESPDDIAGLAARATEQPALQETSGTLGTL